MMCFIDDEKIMVVAAGGTAAQRLNGIEQDRHARRLGGSDPHVTKHGGRDHSNDVKARCDRQRNVGLTGPDRIAEQNAAKFGDGCLRARHRGQLMVLQCYGAKRD